MADDFWGREHLENVKAQPSKVLPDVPPVDLPRLIRFSTWFTTCSKSRRPRTLMPGTWVSIWNHSMATCPNLNLTFSHIMTRMEKV